MSEREEKKLNREDHKTTKTVANLLKRVVLTGGGIFLLKRKDDLKYAVKAVLNKDVLKLLKNQKISK